jgi:hypothetical protein
MNAQTAQLIIAAIPIATDILIKVGDRVISMKENGMEPADLLLVIDQARQEGWPVFKFKSAQE